VARELWKESDGQFTIRAWAELNRHGNFRFRIRYGYRGGGQGQDSAPTEAKAVAKAKAIWRAHLDGVLDSPPSDPTTLGELVDRFVERGRLANATQETYLKTLVRFVKLVGADRPLTHVGKGAVKRWFHGMTCSNTSKKSYHRTLKALFRWAIKEKYVREDPTTDIVIDVERKGIRPWLQHRDWAPFLAACGPGHRIRAEFALHVGLRAGELAAARHDWLHGTVGRPAISVPASKSARARAIPLDRRAQELIEEAKAQWPDSEFLFHNGGVDPHNFRRDTVLACRKAEVKQVDFHGLRRSCGARWLELGIPLLSVSRMLGHADVTTTARHYAGIADQTLAAEIDKVDAAAEADRQGNGNVIPLRGRK
jgi:integrase